MAELSGRIGNTRSPNGARETGVSLGSNIGAEPGSLSTGTPSGRPATPHTELQGFLSFRKTIQNLAKLRLAHLSVRTRTIYFDLREDRPLPVSALDVLGAGDEDMATT